MNYSIELPFGRGKRFLNQGGVLNRVAGGWEINITSSVEQTRAATAIEAPLFDINYGFRDNDQLKVEFAVVSPNFWNIFFPPVLN